MTLFRIVFVALALAALGGTSYVAWYGYGSASSDASPSIRQGSGGASAIAGRVK